MVIRSYFCRSRKKNNLTNIIIERLKKNTSSLFIFPEGTRNFKPKSLKKLKTGGFVIAQKTGIPIVPICINTLESFNDKTMLYIKNQETKIIFGNPIITKNKLLDDIIKEYKQFYIDNGFNIE